MKIAIVHDELMVRGGAEQVALSMLKAFPDADFYTMCYDPKNTYPEYENYNVRTSLFRYIAKSDALMKRFFFPFGLWAMKVLKIKGYDLVLISTTFCAKHVKTDPGTIVINYTYTPFRLAWNPTSYAQYVNARGLKKLAFDIVIKYLRYTDARAHRKADYFLSMTKETAKRIEDAYHVSNITLIRPDVKCRNFHVSDGEKSYFLLVARLETYKKVDLCIEAFNKLGSKLIIVGTGTKEKQLKAQAKSNIEFRSGLSITQLSEMYANCKAFIFPQHEDYGITPLEANASGRPVIAYGKGGVLETMIPFKDDASKATAIFFNEQTADSLIAAINQFENLKFDPAFIRQHAKEFDEAIFIDKLRSFVNDKYKSKAVAVV